MLECVYRGWICGVGKWILDAAVRDAIQHAELGLQDALKDNVAPATATFDIGGLRREVTPTKVRQDLKRGHL
ncbi:hypothetical protein ASA1KI_21450 [Opitutales bacterium ASA1]|nr:hypothetical protein ASA1KI_21450 [Opitutales bacterium ASA1]